MNDLESKRKEMNEIIDKILEDYTPKTEDETFPNRLNFKDDRSFKYNEFTRVIKIQISTLRYINISSPRYSEFWDTFIHNTAKYLEALYYEGYLTVDAILVIGDNIITTAVGHGLWKLADSVTKEKDNKNKIGN